MKLTLVLALLYLAVILIAAFTAPGTAPGDRRGSVNLGSSPVPTAMPSRHALETASRSRAITPRLHWHALFLCESSDNPRAVSPTGRFRGLAQFDQHTWESVGGHGDPADASRAEQTLRAQLLYASRGREPWPRCGARL